MVAAPLERQNASFPQPRPARVVTCKRHLSRLCLGREHYPFLGNDRAWTRFTLKPRTRLAYLSPEPFPYGLRPASFSSISLPMIFGSALPPEIFITCPVRKLRACCCFLGLATAS